MSSESSESSVLSVLSIFSVFSVFFEPDHFVQQSLTQTMYFKKSLSLQPVAPDVSLTWDMERVFGSKSIRLKNIRLKNIRSPRSREFP